MTESMQAELPETQRHRNRNRFLLLLVYALLISPWVVAGAVRALEGNANSPLDWVDQGFAPRQEYDRFSARFGTADVVVISWPECHVDDPRLDTFVRCLREAKGFQGDDGWLFHQVTSGRQTLQAMTDPPLSLPREEAIDRLQGSLVGPDRKTTSVVVSFTEAGLQQRGRLVGLIRAAARQHCDAGYESQHLAGPIMDGYSVDQASQTTMHRFAPLASIIAFCLCVLCLDSLIAACLVFGVSLACQGIALAVLHYSGGSMTALLIVLPPLIQLLAIASGIHFVNYYFDAATTSAAMDAATRAFQIAWLPCVLSAVTTAIGLGSLMVSGLVAVREFGFYASIGIVATTAVLLSFLPGAVSWLSPAVPKSRSRSNQSKVWLALTTWLRRHSEWVSVSACVLMVGLGVGVSQLEASVRIETLFGKNSRLLDDYAWIEQHVGSTVPIEVVAEFPTDPSLTAIKKLTTLNEIESVLRKVSQVDSVFSPLSFMPVFPPNDEAVASRVMQQSSPIAQDFNYLNVSRDGVESWRTTAYISALGDNDYVSILRQLNQDLARKAHPGSSALDVTVETSGLMPLVHEIQQQLLSDLFSSFVVAFALIAAIMSIVQADIYTGILSMIPNVFPALTLFGFLGWTGQPLDIGSIMTASVAMGIAVDDTLHFLTFFDRELRTGKSRPEAVMNSYVHCGRAMIQTTLICGGGFAIFALSEFVPTARFAWMMIVLLGAALVGDLLVLPALLLGPAGKRFEQRQPKPSVAEDDQRDWQHRDDLAQTIRIHQSSTIKRSTNAGLRQKS
ncbi:MAG: RND family transporter [Rubripirellula sp.]